jgi:tricorn protease
LADKSVFKLTGDYTNDANPVFDPGGKYLYFLSARDFSPSFVAYEFNHYFRNKGRPYAIILQADGASPFAPKGDDKTGNKTNHPGMKIDLPGIQQRVVVFPVQRGNYGMLRASKDHIFYCKFNDDEGAGLFVYNLYNTFGFGSAGLYVFNLDHQKETKLQDPVNSYSISFDGKKLLYRSGSTFGILDAAPKQVKPGGEKIDLSGMEMWRHPRKEWHNCFYETWRLFRDFFYVPNLHGVDWLKIRETYAELLPYISTRNDLTYVLAEMIGELGASHCYVGGGDKPTEKYHGVGLPGATFEPTKSGFYKISKIYAGENWHEKFRSPLTEPGIHVKEGEYILAIDGVELRAGDNPYRLLVNKTDGTVELTINLQPSIKGSRQVKIKPIPDEKKLRYYNWVKRNRDYVSEKTGGKVGYIHLPDMMEFGLSEFGKWYYGQLDKDGLIVDARFNGGGFVSDQVLERLIRPLYSMENNRNLSPSTYPYTVFVGPKAAITNLYAGSDGDAFAFSWKQYKLGPLIGTRTWGGVIGVRAFTPMLDGGYTYVPVGGMYDFNSKFIIENQGVEPDIEIDNLPKDLIAGKDPQLDKAIELVLQAMKDYKPRRAPKPTEYPER